MVRHRWLLIPLVSLSCAAAPPTPGSPLVRAASPSPPPGSTELQATSHREGWLIFELAGITVHLPPIYERSGAFLENSWVTNYSAVAARSRAWFRVSERLGPNSPDDAKTTIARITENNPACPDGRAAPLVTEQQEDTELTRTLITCRDGSVRVEIRRSPKVFHVLTAPSSPATKVDVDRFFDSIRPWPKPPLSKPTNPWRTYTSPAYHFEVHLPNQPTVSARELEDGKKLELVLAPIGDSGARFSIAAMDAAGGTGKDTAADLVNAMARAPECSGQVAELRKGHPTAASRYQVYCMSGVTLLMDVHVRERTYFAVIAALPPDIDDVTEAQYSLFHNSFRTLD